MSVWQHDDVCYVILSFWCQTERVDIVLLSDWHKEHHSDVSLTAERCLLCQSDIRMMSALSVWHQNDRQILPRGFAIRCSAIYGRWANPSAVVSERICLQLFLTSWEPLSKQTKKCALFRAHHSFWREISLNCFTCTQNIQTLSFFLQHKIYKMQSKGK